MILKFWKGWRTKPAAETPNSAEYPKKNRRTLSMLTGRGVFGMFKASDVSATDTWSATPISPDALITRRQMSLVARSREQWSNNDYVRAFIRLVRQNVVGPHGVLMQAKATKARGKLDKDANDAHEEAWEHWCKPGNCEVTGKMSFRLLQCLVVETTARDGEFFARLIYGKDAGPCGFAIQMIDPQRLPVWYENYNRRDDGGFIRHGIEYNRFGRAEAYHFASTDEWDAYYYTYGGHGFVRIPASEIIHGFVPEMVGQRRGLPWASTSLFRLHHMQGFEDAAVQNARASATKMGFIQYKEGFGPEVEDGTDVAASIEAEPLSFHELPEGAEFKEFTPNYPTGEFATFHKAMLRGAAAGMGVLYNNMAGDLEGVNFSSIRQGTLDEREHWKEVQQWLIETFIMPVHRAWLQFELLKGTIKVNGQPLAPEKFSVYCRVKWQARRWQWIDPGADVKAAVDSIRGGLASPSSIIREQGKDPETVYQEIAQDVEAMKAAGIDEDLIKLFLTGAMMQQQQPQKQEKEKPQNG